MKISAHVLVKNEARFIWYSVMSVISFVDGLRIWDTGSTDQTVKIIEEILKTKEAKKLKFIDYRRLGDIDFNERVLRQRMLNSDFQIEDTFTASRDTMLDESTADWIFVLDADEIWWEESIKKVISTIREGGFTKESIVVPTVNVIGDIFHYQEKEAGRYKFGSRFGHYNLRAFNRKIEGIHGIGGHGTFTWVDVNGVRIEERGTIHYVNAPYLHATHLPRSGMDNLDRTTYKRWKKRKYELGNSFKKDFYYPEVFFRDRPNNVPSPWLTRTTPYEFRAFFETPLKKIRRRYFMNNSKYGY